MTDAEKIARLSYRLDQATHLIEEMRGQAEAAGTLIEHLQRERDHAVESARVARQNLQAADEYISWQYQSETGMAA